MNLTDQEIKDFVIKRLIEEGDINEESLRN